jgi:hypothetical protein
MQLKGVTLDTSHRFPKYPVMLIYLIKIKHLHNSQRIKSNNNAKHVTHYM